MADVRYGLREDEERGLECNKGPGSMWLKWEEAACVCIVPPFVFSATIPFLAR